MLIVVIFSTENYLFGSQQLNRSEQFRAAKVTHKWIIKITKMLSNLASFARKCVDKPKTAVYNVYLEIHVQKK